MKEELLKKGEIGDNPKFSLPNNKQIIDYIDAAGFGLGFAVGNAAKLIYLFNNTTDMITKERYQKSFTWYINHVSKVHNIAIEEVVEMVNKIVSKIESDQKGTENEG